MRQFIAIIGASLGLAGFASAETIYVYDGESIQAAVDSSSDGDEIIVGPGTYTSTQDGHVVDMKGRAVTLRSSDGPDVTTIDGQGARRVIVCGSGETNATLIQGFRITNGSAVSPNDEGGGLYCVDGSSPSIIDCEFFGNTANSGGGVYCYSYSEAVFEGCKFIGNIATVGAGQGGGLNATGSKLQISDCIFESNTARGGGGIKIENDSGTTISNCIFNANTVVEAGGGLYIDGSGASDVVVMTNCTISNNLAMNGGGLCATYEGADITGCNIESNTAYGEGGGLYSSAGPTDLFNSNICSNFPDQTYGAWNDTGGSNVSEVCPWYQGACCSNDICVVSEEDDCDTFGGSWLGVGTSCSDSPCPSACLGDVDGNGGVNIDDLLLVIARFGVTCP